MRRLTSKWSTVALSVGAMALMAGAQAQVMRKMILTDQGTLPGGRINVPKRLNLSGISVGYIQKTVGVFSAFLHDTPIMYDLGVLPGRSDGRNNWINRFNVVAGTSGQGVLAKGYIWNNGNMSVLPDLDPMNDWPTEGIGINDAGSVLWNEDRSGLAQGATFKQANYRTQFLQGQVPLVGSMTTMHGTAISNLDWIAGVGPKPDGSVGAWLFQLPDPMNTGRTPTEVTVSNTVGAVATVTDISDISLDGGGDPSITGMVSTFVRDGNGVPTYQVPIPFITLGTTPHNPVLLPGHNIGEVYGINNAGLAVGRSGSFEIRNGVGIYTWKACVFAPVLPAPPFWQAFPITDYMPVNSGITMDNLNDINDAGQIVGIYTQAGNIRSLLMTPTITPINVSLLNATLPGGNATTGNVVIDSLAPFGGVVVNLSANSSLAAVPATVTVAQGQDNANFPVTSSPVLTPTNVLITATRSGYSVSTTLRLMPTALDTLVINPTFITGGQRANATVNLAGRAPSGGFKVDLFSSNTNAAIVAASVTVPAGANTVGFLVYTKAVTVNTPVQIRATAKGVTRSVNMTVATPFLDVLHINENEVFGGQQASGYVQISGKAMAPGAVVSMASSTPSVASVPTSVTILTGTQVASFKVTTVRVRFNTNVTISGTFNTQTRTKTLLVKGAALLSVSANPATVKGGLNSQGRVVLDWFAPTGGSVVSLVSGDTSVVTVPPSVTVAQATTVQVFTITTRPVTANRNVTITGNYLGVTRTGTITLTP